MTENFLKGKKGIALIGMSGIGKTHLTQLLTDGGYESCSIDFEIGTKHLKTMIEQALGEACAVTINDLSQISRYIGQVGATAEGGRTLALFSERQTTYNKAETDALRAALLVEGESDPSQAFILDTTGSFCEIDDKDLVAQIAEKFLIVYLEADEESRKAAIARAVDNPKPMYYPPKAFEKWVEAYCTENSIDDIEQAHPHDFARWVFPKLFAARLEKYERLAAQYGLTISVDRFNNAENAEDVCAVIQHHAEKDAA